MLFNLKRVASPINNFEIFNSRILRFFALTKLDPTEAESSTRNSVITATASTKASDLDKFRKRMRTCLLDAGKLFVSTEKDDEQSIRLTFLHEYGKQKSRQVSLSRKVDTLLMDTLHRLAFKLNLSKDGNKKSKHKPNSVTSALNDYKQFNCIDEIRVETSIGHFLDPSVTTNRSAFIELGTNLHIKELKLCIIKDTPYFDKFKIDVRLIAGFPVLPSVDVVNGLAEDCILDWFVECEPGSVLNDKISVSRIDNTEAQSRFCVENFEYRSTGVVFIPCLDDVGKRVLLIGTPRNSTSYGITYSYLSSTAVEALPSEEMIWEERQVACASLAGKSNLRLVSYNVLADLYLELDKLPQEELFFAHCPVDLQRHKYRYPLLLKEISGYNGDLMFLQEVDTRFHKRFVKPFFESLNFRVLYSKKRGDVNEGVAMIINQSKLEYLKNFDTILSELLLQEKYVDIKRVAELDDSAYKILSSRPAVLQVNCFRMLEKDKPTILCACNTHLHFHPKQGHIRLHQIALCLRYINFVLAELKDAYPFHNVGVIFCGDLNSLPDSTVIRCLSEGYIDACEPDWFDQHNDELESNHFDRKGTEVRAPLKLESSCPAAYTNYVGENHFFGCLDYILLGRNSENSMFRVSKQLAMPRHELVTKYYGLPSRIAPSDHLALVCDIEIYC